MSCEFQMNILLWLCWNTATNGHKISFERCHVRLFLVINCFYGYKIIQNCLKSYVCVSPINSTRSSLSLGSGWGLSMLQAISLLNMTWYVMYIYASPNSNVFRSQFAPIRYNHWKYCIKYVIKTPVKYFILFRYYDFMSIHIFVTTILNFRIITHRPHAATSNYC